MSEVLDETDDDRQLADAMAVPAYTYLEYKMVYSVPEPLSVGTILPLLVTD